MRRRFRLSLVAVFLFLPALAFSDTPIQEIQQLIAGGGNKGPKSGTDELKETLEKLGKYLGYDLEGDFPPKNFCPNGAKPPFSCLVKKNRVQNRQFSLYSSYLGTLLGTGNSSQPNGNGPLVPDTDSPINSFSTKTFPPDNKFSGTVFDQKNKEDKFQSDPTRQAIFNILATPDFSYADLLKQVTPAPSTREMILSLTFAPPPEQAFLPMPFNQDLVTQLNSNTLLMPFEYTTDNSNAANLSQAQTAANFVRFAAGLNNPLPIARRKAYEDLYNTSQTDENPVNRLLAGAVLGEYFSKLRTYAAQMSVVAGNLYYIFSRRLPQSAPQGEEDSSSSPEEQSASEALNDFKMATWRLVDKKNQGDDKTWLTRLNEGSTASAQKEIAVLLAEINYQLYLTRQQNERMLLTQSIILLQIIGSGKPNPEITQAYNRAVAQIKLEQEQQKGS